MQSVGEHAKCPEGTVIQNRYKVIGEMGAGNFSKVFKCNDTQKAGEADVAVKLLKKEYARDAMFELDILKALTVLSHKENISDKILTLKDFFTWNRHPCFVLPLKGPSLRSKKLGVQRGHVSREELKNFSLEFMKALSFLHFKAKLVHTDLKPDNILLNTDCAQGIGRGWTIADFGSASFYKDTKMDSDLISTRPYRAPEVVLGNGWSYPADMWSAGCILFETYSGARLFEVHDDVEQLKCFESKLGKFPPSLAKNSKHFRKFFDVNGALLVASSRVTASARPDPTKISKTVQEVCAADPEFCDLILRMLDYDPTRRIRADDAQHHPFFVAEEIERPTERRAGSNGRSANADGGDILNMEAATHYVAKSMVTMTVETKENVHPSSVANTPAPQSTSASVKKYTPTYLVPAAGKPSGGLRIIR